MKNGYLQKLASEGFSIIPCSADKRPIGQWSAYRDSPRTVQQVSELDSPLYGIITGINGLEVVDVDIKTIHDAHERRAFWTELLSLLTDHIDDFYEKVVIKKTVSGGYHILYRCAKIQGNSKIAVQKGKKEALIESRGIGGMVIFYEGSENKRDYHQIVEITEEERDTIWYMCQMYNYIDDTPKEVEIKVKKEFNGSSKSPWQDYNEKTDIWDLLHDEFTIPQRGNKSKHILIKRHGSTSAYSGYIFKDSGCAYLFSTGTRYPHEKLLTPFLIYSIQYHGGDTSAAASDLYHQGFGDRVERKVKELERFVPEIKDDILKDINFPIDIFPTPIQSYLIECRDKLDANLDYTGSSMLWLISVCVGNSLEVEVKRGWTEKATLWLSLVGKAGIGKTPSINKVIFPIEQMNLKEIKRYATEYAKFKEYDLLSKKEKGSVPEVAKPVRTQFIANDITTEALVTLHQESDNAVGVFKDELAGWLKDMNKYRAGSDLEFWLSSWSGKSAFMNRITREDSFIDKPFIPILGGIQPSIFSSFYTDENKDNGFMDRMLISYPDATVDSYNENELDYELIEWYKNAIIMFYSQCKARIKFDDQKAIESYKVVFSPEAKTEWIRIFNKISAIQNSDDESEYLKSMYPKQKSYIPRFALLINTINSHFNDDEDIRFISKDSMLKAERLSEYFVNCAKKVRVDSDRVNEMKQVVKSTTSKADKIAALYQANPDYKQSEIAELVGVKRQYVGKIIAELKKAT